MPRIVTMSAQKRKGTSASSTARATICDPRGSFLATASRDRNELVTAELDFDKIREVRDVRQSYRDRRPDSYEALVAP